MRYNFVVICTNNKEGDRNTTHIEGVEGPSFKCPRCGLQLVWIVDAAKGERRLGAHGRTSENIAHELRKVEELR